MNFTNEFLTGLYPKLEDYCNENKFETTHWLDCQELACQGGYEVLVKYCNENGYDYIVDVAEKLRWDDFDDFIYDLSKSLIKVGEELK
jgi:hypothetical protein